MASLAAAYPESAHVAAIGLAKAPDEMIWEYAAANGFVIVTKDDDFHQRSLLRGFPPKVIWLQFGNCPTGIIATALRDRIADVETLVADAGIDSCSASLDSTKTTGDESCASACDRTNA